MNSDTQKGRPAQTALDGRDHGGHGHKCSAFLGLALSFFLSLKTFFFYTDEFLCASITLGNGP